MVESTQRPSAQLARLDGRVALVTGAAQGFGFACADRLSEAGCAVALVDRHEARLGEAVERLRAAGRRAYGRVCDVADEDDVRATVAAAAEQLGGLDVVVSNAGVFSNVRIEHLDAAELRRILSVNVEGTFNVVRAGADEIRRRGDRGAIVVVTSIDAIRPSGEGLSHYSASKHANWGFTKAMALELGPHGIRVNAVAPGPSLTEGAREFVDAGSPQGIDTTAQWDAYAARIPLRRLTDPDDVGRAVTFLAGDLAAGINGAQLVVDGGLVVVA